MTRDALLGIEIQAEPKMVSDMVTSVSGLASFWTSDVEGDGAPGGRLTMGFAAAPTRLPIEVIGADAPGSIEWVFGGDWPFWDGTRAAWSLDEGEGTTRVTFRHDGFTDEMPEFDFGKIVHTWAAVLTRLKEIVESGGRGVPALG